jgi:hemoglobin
MKRDIETREDVVAILTAFYEKAFKDNLIGFFFLEVVPLDLETHIPVIADFWESVLFGTRGYRKNVMELHQHISGLSPIKKEHLDRWVQLFTLTVNDMAEGNTAELMKQRARSIATMMEIKLSKDFKF